MKKGIALLLTCIMLISCQSRQNVTNDTYILLGNYAISDNGIYSFNNNKHIIEFYDIETDKQVPLCDKTVCNHANNECTAYSLCHYKNDTVLGSQPMYFNNSLYLFYEKYGENNYLCRANIDGSDRKLITTLDNEDPFLVQNLILYQNKAIFTANLIKKDEEKNESGPSNEFITQSIDLNTGKIQNIEFEKNSKNFYNPIGAYKDCVYFSCTQEDKSMHIYKYNIKQEKGEYFLQNVSIDTLSSFVNNGYIYYPNFDNHYIYECDLDTQEIKKLSQIENIENKDMMRVQNFRGRLLMIWELEDKQMKDIQYYDCVNKRFIQIQDHVVDIYEDKYLIKEDNGGIMSYKLKDI